MATEEQRELVDRVKARQKQLEARYHKLKADTRAEVRQERDRLKARLDELEEMTRSGWERMTDAARDRLNDWLKKV